MSNNDKYKIFNYFNIKDFPSCFPKYQKSNFELFKEKINSFIYNLNEKLENYVFAYKNYLYNIIQEQELGEYLFHLIVDVTIPALVIILIAHVITGIINIISDYVIKQDDAREKKLFFFSIFICLLFLFLINLILI